MTARSDNLIDLLREIRGLERREYAAEDIDEKRDIREERWNLVGNYIQKAYIYNPSYGLKSRYIQSINAYSIDSNIISEKMVSFLSNVYLGPLYGDFEYDEVAIGNPLGDYLYFLNVENPYYRVASKWMITLLIKIYLEVNSIKRLKESILSIPQTLIGTNPDIQIRSYFRDEYDEIDEKYISHQDKYNEIKGEPLKFDFNGKIYTSEKKVWRLPPDDIVTSEIVRKIINNNVFDLPIIPDEAEAETLLDEKYITYIDIKPYLKYYLPLAESLSYSYRVVLYGNNNVRDDPKYDPLKILDPQIKGARS